VDGRDADSARTGELGQPEQWSYQPIHDSDFDVGGSERRDLIHAVPRHREFAFAIRRWHHWHELHTKSSPRVWHNVLLERRRGQQRWQRSRIVDLVVCDCHGTASSGDSFGARQRSHESIDHANPQLECGYWRDLVHPLPRHKQSATAVRDRHYSN
jgi:hypothetical protein